MAETVAGSKKRGRIRRVLRVLRWLGLAFLLLAVIGTVAGWRGFGHRAEGARRARMERSPQWKDGEFSNPQTIVNHGWDMLTDMFGASDETSPKAPLLLDPIEPGRFAEPPTDGLRVTWLGHSSTLIEIDGQRILTDPMWSERVGPIRGIGPSRWFAPLIALDALPHVDAVLISHDHYDHCDMGTLIAMKDWNTTFVVPLGVGAHLEYWGIPAARIVELDWWEETRVGALQLVATPARHASGRTPFDRDATLWASYALIGDRHRVYFSGDTGLFPAMADIGTRFGPFDLTMIEVGQYDGAWPDWHIGPEQAVTAHTMLRGKQLLPIHWGLLALAYHGWTEPIERVVAAADAAHVTLLTPKPGQSVEPDRASAPNAPNVHWWPAVPWRHAEQAPIVSSQLGP